MADRCDSTEALHAAGCFSSDPDIWERRAPDPGLPSFTGCLASVLAAAAAVAIIKYALKKGASHGLAQQ